MRGFVPLFLTFVLTSQVWSSPVHQSRSLFDGPSSQLDLVGKDDLAFDTSIGNDARTHLEELEEFLEDRAKARKKVFKKKDVKHQVQGTIPAPGELFEGDMIMDEQLRQAVLGEADKRSMTTNPDKRWKNGIVPYVFDPNIAPKSKKCLQLAMAAFHKHTCIVFRKKTAADVDYLYLKSKPNYCSSWVGRRGGQQAVHIGHGCTRLGTCEHELLHALGMIHEQSRTDRDEHVDVKWDNIKDKERHNFNKYSYNRVDDEGVEFNFGSVMMYPNHAFAIDREYPTIVSKKDPALIFGQRKQFSTGDVAQVNRLYNCPKDKYASDLVEMLSDEKIEEALQFADDKEDFQPLVGM